MAFRPLHLLLTFVLLMVYIEMTLSEEEDEFDYFSEDELEDIEDSEELVPRHYRRRRSRSRKGYRYPSRRSQRRSSRKYRRSRSRKSRPRPGPRPNVCSPSPCRNGGICKQVKGRPSRHFRKAHYSFRCSCKHGFYGRNCEIADPCKNKPCLNGGKCERWGRTNMFTCKCRAGYRGSKCEDGTSTCYARGDPHYYTFDKKKFDFMGSCQYVLAEDCGGGHAKEFVVLVKNVKCGHVFQFRRGASCTESVTVLLAGDKIKLTRDASAVLINNVKVSRFPVIKSAEGYEITKPTSREIYLTSNKVGLTVSWDCNMAVEVTITDRHKGKTCGLCGNNNGNPFDDHLPNMSQACKPLPERPCVPNAATKAEIDKCRLMKSSPFQACNAVVDPSALIDNCKYDVCRCVNPIECACSSFASYSKQCAENGKIINWRFQGTFLYPPLKACARKCENPGEIFKECGFACERTCRDVSRRSGECSEECIPGCQCPVGQLLNEESRCVPIAECPCQHEGKIIQAGNSVEVGKCATCTCVAGVMSCVDDKDCNKKGPCESFPCKNNGKCTEQENSFSCECTGDYQGKTCEELKPKPCDSQPCLNDGVCTNEGDSFTCECLDGFKGKTCADADCLDTKLDILYVVDGSGSVRSTNFENIKLELIRISSKFDIGIDKTQIALMQFGRSTDTRIEFKLGEKTSLREVIDGVRNMNYLASIKTATGDALKRAYEQVFNGGGGDRSSAPNVLILFTDGSATDSASVDQFDQAKKLKDAGVKIITVGMGVESTLSEFRETLKRLASVDDKSGEILQYEADFAQLNDLTSKLVRNAC